MQRCLNIAGVFKMKHYAVLIYLNLISSGLYHHSPPPDVMEKFEENLKREKIKEEE
jgi:hypothetical protein